MAEQEQKRKKHGRAARAELYVPQAGGGYRYTGKYYDFPEGQRFTSKRLTQLRTGLAALTLLLTLGSGLLNSPGMRNTFYVILPFMGSFICGIAMAWSAGRAMYHGVPLKEYVYEATIVRLRGLTLFQLFFAVLAAAGEIVFLILSEEKDLALSLLFAALQLLAGASSLTLKLIERQCRWEKNETK